MALGLLPVFGPFACLVLVPVGVDVSGGDAAPVGVDVSGGDAAGGRRRRRLAGRGGAPRGCRLGVARPGCRRCCRPGRRSRSRPGALCCSGAGRRTVLRPGPRLARPCAGAAACAVAGAPGACSPWRVRPFRAPRQAVLALLCRHVHHRDQDVPAPLAQLGLQFGGLQLLGHAQPGLGVAPGLVHQVPDQSAPVDREEEAHAFVPQWLEHVLQDLVESGVAEPYAPPFLRGEVDQLVLVRLRKVGQRPDDRLEEQCALRVALCVAHRLVQQLLLGDRLAALHFALYQGGVVVVLGRNLVPCLFRRPAFAGGFCACAVLLGVGCLLFVVHR